MKFALQTAMKCSGRVGNISEIQRIPSVTLETPLLLLYTKGGSVPHLTHEVLQMVTSEPLGIQITLASTYNCHEAIGEFKKGISEFVGLKECLTYCSVQDPAIQIPSGFNGKNQISIWSRRGKEQVEPEKYMDIMEAYRPDIYHTLCDGDVNSNTTKKRLQKSVDRTHAFFEKCMARHLKSEVLKSSAIFAVVEGGLDKDLRVISAKKTAEADVDGFVLDGFTNCGPKSETLAFEEFQTVLEETLKHLPPSKLRVIHGAWSPEVILNLVELGIDVFDTSYPYIVTERGGAIIFGESNNEISLKDTIYKDKLQPLSDHCKCLTCQQHTCAYIHHLLNVKELLAPVLLMIHNVHQYLEFFKDIRTSLKNDSIGDLRKRLNKTLI